MAAIYGVLFGERREPAERQFNQRLNVEDLRESDIISRYRLPRHLIWELINLIKDDITPQAHRGNAIEPETKVLLTLRYLAKGDLYSEVGDIHGVSKSSMSRHLHEVVGAINRRLNNIRFPTTAEERTRTSIQFMRLCGIPRVLGAVDGTLIPIVGPKENEASFVCRKGFHALNVQAVVDTDLRFTDVVSRWPGSTNDAAIFSQCELKNYLERNDVGCLLGDSGYALRPYLLTPVFQPSNTQETLYNNAHSRGRVGVERAFGVLKSRFRCLHKSGGCLLFEPRKCCQIVTACMKLHNMCIDNGVPLQGQLLPDDGDVPQAPVTADSSANRSVRNRIIRMF